MKAMSLLCAGLLAGCQLLSERALGHVPPPSHRGAGTGAGFSGSGGATASGTVENADSGGGYDMCALDSQIQSAGTVEMRRALIEKALPDMAPDARERQLQMMEQNCR
jgi:hypothetical protein